MGKQKDFGKEIDNLNTQKSEINTKMLDLLRKWGQTLGIRKIIVESNQEYDDNNYYNQIYISEIYVEGIEENICDLELHYFNLDSDFPGCLDEIETIETFNTIKFIADDRKNKYLGITEDQVEDINFGKLLLHFLQKDQMEEAIAFLASYLDAGENCQPEEF